jgi:outer membrane protein
MFRHLLAALLATTSIVSPALAAEMPKAGDWIVRARAIGVIPDEDASITGAVTGSQIDIDTAVVPELDFTYFATDNIALELIAAIAPHDVNTNTSSAGPLDLGDVWLLPPTLTAQYHFTDFGQCKPYLGAGVNYTHFFGEDKGTSVTSVDYDDSFGPVLQAGMDYMLDDHWMLNVDVKRVWINTDVKFNNGAIRADVDINPWIVGVGVGYKF